jgi:uncharacterized membrane protein (DUF106 family)
MPDTTNKIITGFGDLLKMKDVNGQNPGWLKTSNVVPIILLAGAMLGFYGSFSSAQTRQEERTSAGQAQIVEIKADQKQLRLDIKDELKAMNAQLEATRQALFQIQQSLLAIQSKRQP